jgi:hypothetical protein
MWCVQKGLMSSNGEGESFEWCISWTNAFTLTVLYGLISPLGGGNLLPVFGWGGDCRPFHWSFPFFIFLPRFLLLFRSRRRVGGFRNIF